MFKNTRQSRMHKTHLQYYSVYSDSSMEQDWPLLEIQFYHWTLPWQRSRRSQSTCRPAARGKAWLSLCDLQRAFSLITFSSQYMQQDQLHELYLASARQVFFFFLKTKMSKSCITLGYEYIAQCLFQNKQDKRFIFKRIHYVCIYGDNTLL